MNKQNFGDNDLGVDSRKARRDKKKNKKMKISGKSVQSLAKIISKKKK